MQVEGDIDVSPWSGGIESTWIDVVGSSSSTSAVDLSSPFGQSS